MNQVFTPYWDWECFNNGMWSKEGVNDKEKLNQAIEFTSDHLKYGRAMKEVVLEWENSMINHLTNPSINKKAFIGHCACSYREGLNESIVRKAWKFLTEEQKYLANKEAEKAYLLWKEERKKELMITSKNGKADAIHQTYLIQFR